MKRTIKAISLIISIIFLMEAMPMVSFAEMINAEADANEIFESGNDAVTDFSGYENDSEDEARIIGEIIEERELNAKKFRMSDGSIMQAVYPYNVHFEDNGEMKEIDNSLAETEDSENEKALGNNSNIFNVKFKKKSNGNKLYDLEYNGSKIRVGIEGVKKVTAEKIEKNETVSDSYDELKIRNTSSEVVYRNIFKNTDIYYAVTGDRIKENIVLKKAVDFDSITYTYKITGVNAVQKDDKTIELYGKDGELATVLSAPVMWDAEGNSFDNLTLTLGEKKNNEVKIILAWNGDITSDNNTAYPVTIDPVMKFSVEKNDITDTYITTADPDDSTRGSLEHVRISNGKYCAYTMLKFTPPTLTSGDKVVKAQLNLCPLVAIPGTPEDPYSNKNSFNPPLYITAHKILKSWSAGSTYNSVGSLNEFYDSKVVDYTLVDNDSHFYTWDVTSLVNEWYEGTSNNGVLLKFDKKPQDSSFSAYFCSTNGIYTPSDAYPQIIFQYVNTTGIENYYSAHAQNVGCAGTVYTNDMTGNLTLINNVLTLGSANAPIDVSLVYNTNDVAKTATPYGAGWNLNWAQSIKATSLTFKKDNADLKYWKYTDGDGTEHYFLQDSASSNNATDEVNSARKITYNTSTYDYVMSDDGGTKLYFKKKSGADEWYLYKSADQYGNSVTATLHPTYMNRITKLESSAGYAVYFTYNTQGYLTVITYREDESDKTINILYNNHTSSSNNSISDIDFADGTGADYYYGDNKLLSKAVDFDGYSMEYAYSKGSTSAPNRVCSVTEKGTNGTQGQKMTLRYGLCNTTLKDETNGRTYLYTFTHLGTLKSVVDVTCDDGNGYGQYYEYNNGSTDVKGKGNLTFAGSTEKSTANLLANHSFESEAERYSFTIWNNNASASSAGYSTGKHYIGYKSVKLNRADNNCSRVLGYYYITLKAGQQYTFSAYVNTSGLSETVSGGASLFVHSNNYTFESEFVTEKTASDEWKRIFVTFTPPVDGGASLCMNLSGTTGVAYFDCLQFETGDLSEYNLLDNGGFEFSSYAWGKSSGTGAVISSSDKIAGSNSVSMTSTPDSRCDYFQTIPVSGAKGDAYVASAFAKAYSAPSRPWSFVLLVRFYNGSTIVNDCTFEFNTNVSQWQKVSGAAVAKGAYTRITVWVLYYNNVNTAYFDNVQLVKDTFGHTYTYDSKGNITSTTDLNGKAEHTFSYDGSSQLIKQTNISGSRIFYAYNSSKNQEIDMVSGGGVTTSFKYDLSGNATNSRTESTELTAGKYYYVKNVYTGEYLTADGSNAKGDSFKKSDTQKWLLTSVGDNNWKLSPASSSGLYLSSESNSPANAGNVGLYSSGKTYNTFRFDKFRGNIYRIRFSATDSFGLDFYLSNAIVYEKHSGEAQQYVVEPCGDNNGEGHLTISSGASYDSAGNVTMTTDSRGNKTRYNYLYATGLTDRTEDAKGNVTSYSYNASHQPLSVSSDGSTVSYAYDASKLLSDITSPSGTPYSFTYDCFGRMLSTKVGSSTLSSNAYNAKGLLTSSTYGNGTVKSYEYDSLNRLKSSSVKQSGESAAVLRYNYTYDSSGRLVGTDDVLNKTITKSEYDLLDRLTTVRTIDKVTNKVVSDIKVSYDGKNRISGYSILADGIRKSTSYTWGEDNPDIITALNADGNQIDYTYDSLNRLAEKKLKLNGENNNYTTSYSYVSGKRTDNGAYYPSYCEDRTVVGDFNGDGRSDIAEMYNYAGGARIHLWLAKEDGTYGNPSTAFDSANSASLDASKATGRMTAGDYDEDGMDEIAFMYDSGNASIILYVLDPAVSSTGYVTMSISSWLSGSAYAAEKVTGRMTSGDYDGDGKDEIAAMYDYGDGKVKMHVFTSKYKSGRWSFGWSPWYSQMTDGWYYADHVTGRMASGDFDGDGADEIAALYKYTEAPMQIHVFDSDEVGDMSWTSWYQASSAASFPADRVTGTVTAGDFSGDGRDDLAVMFNYIGYSDVLVFETTDNKWNDSWWRWHRGKGSYTQSSVSGRIGAGDCDGDGTVDIIGLTAASESSLSVYVWKTNPAGKTFDLKRDIWNSENMVLSDSAATTTLVGTMTNGSDTLSYTYDELGNITSVSENGQLKSTYHYDGKNQLVREDNAGGYTFVYEYDNGGNILDRKEYNYTPADEIPDAEHTDSRAVYEYENSEWKDLLTKYNGASITYDEIGNPLSYYNGWNMTWTDGRKLESIDFGDGATSTFKYNESGKRISKTRMGEETRYVLNGSSIVCEIRHDGSKLYYFYDEAGSAVGFEYYDSSTDTAPDSYYYVKNLQGDVIKLIDKDGNCVVNYSYNTWGVVTVVSDTSTNNLASINPILYRGYYYDWETGFYYLNSRYYDPEIGRFISPDATDTLTATPTALTDKNLFAYCDNNPIVRVDGDGEFWHLVIGAAFGAIVNGAISAISQYATTGEVNWKELAVDCVSGAISGALSMTGIGTMGSIGLNAALGGVTYAAEQKVKGEKVTFGGVLAGVVSGGIGGAIGGKGVDGKNLASTWKNASKRILRESRRANVKYATKQIAKYTVQKTLVKTTIKVAAARYGIGTVTAAFARRKFGY